MPPRPPMSQMRLDLKPTPMVLRLIIINVLVWIVVAGLVNVGNSHRTVGFLREFILLRADGVIGDWFVWQPATYMWLHDLATPWHLLMNMLGLFFLGGPLERRWGRRTFLRFYILCGIIAGLFSVLCGLVLPGLFGAPIMGASGAIMGLLAAFSLTMPTAEILLFFVLPIKARYIIWLALGMDLLFFIADTNIAIQTHVGGVIAAWLLITGSWRPQVAWARLRLSLKGGRGGVKRKGLKVIQGGRGGKRYLN